MKDYPIKHAFVTISFTFFSLQIILIVVSGSSSPPYQPIDNILIDSGSYGNSYVYGDQNRTWVGDIDSIFFPSHPQLIDGTSFPLEADMPSTSAISTVPYITARVSSFEFTYFFSVSTGLKFIRLYFYSANYISFDRSKALFSVRAGRFTLLRDFNTSNPQTNLIKAATKNFDDMLKAHISPVVKVLCARRALIRDKDEITVLLAELAQQCYREKRIDEIIDSKIKDEIALNA
ncbi:receptor-like protein kinase FERONIA [Cucumis melo var. makuwa]|uniref:Receptor-like protein kinase FERONIA n=1 Tax=Cucumis melo var. makuwa TaxID=1194695 RepID=A0A5D3BC49_CUCMM|nr:receptor-like protein kinase FERONIA [Cucumis melo var. makuwa]